MLLKESDIWSAGNIHDNISQSACLCVCLCVSLCVYMSVDLHDTIVCLHGRPSVCSFVCVRLYNCTSLSVRLICRSTYPTLGMSTSIIINICLLICLSICVCMSICLSVCPLRSTPFSISLSVCVHT